MPGIRADWSPGVGGQGGGPRRGECSFTQGGRGDGSLAQRLGVADEAECPLRWKVGEEHPGKYSVQTGPTHGSCQ